MVFSSKQSAQVHAKIHTHSFLCPRKGCFQRFQTFDDALRHAGDKDHPSTNLFLCPVPICTATVTGMPLTQDQIEAHKQFHVELGHIQLSDFVPQPAQELPVHSDLPLYSLIVRHQGLDLEGKRQYTKISANMGGTLGDSSFKENDADVMSISSDNNDNRDDDSDHDSDGDDDREMQDDFLLREDDPLDFECRLLTQEHRLRIHQHNTVKWGRSYLILRLVDV
jgi:hypothetical protein